MVRYGENKPGLDIKMQETKDVVGRWAERYQTQWPALRELCAKTLERNYLDLSPEELLRMYAYGSVLDNNFTSINHRALKSVLDNVNRLLAHVDQELDEKHSDKLGEPLYEVLAKVALIDLGWLRRQIQLEVFVSRYCHSPAFSREKVDAGELWHAASSYYIIHPEMMMRQISVTLPFKPSKERPLEDIAIVSILERGWGKRVIETTPDLEERIDEILDLRFFHSIDLLERLKTTLMVLVIDRGLEVTYDEETGEERWSLRNGV